MALFFQICFEKFEYEILIRCIFINISLYTFYGIYEVWSLLFVLESNNLYQIYKEFKIKYLKAKTLYVHIQGIPLFLKSQIYLVEFSWVPVNTSFEVVCTFKMLINV